MCEESVQAPNENAEKDPSDWVTGDEPMTGAHLTKAGASEMIDGLQASTGRGQ